MRLLTRSVAWALGVCAGVFAVDMLFSVLLGVTHPAPEIHARIPGVEAWRGIPLSFYASITEELVLLRTYLILLIPGLIFGYLYWMRGLETAIACHFFVDIVVHVIRPLVDRPRGVGRLNLSK